MASIDPKLLSAPRAERTQWFPWKHGIDVEIRYTPKATLARVARDLSPSRGAAQLEGVQEKTSRRAAFRAACVNWRGATLGHFKTLAGVPIPDDQMALTLDFNETNVIQAMEHWYNFEEFIISVATDAASFEGEPPEAEEGRLGN